MPDPLQVRHRNLPHWELQGSVYFVTFRLVQGTLTVDERQLVMSHLQAGSQKFYTLLAAVVLPDHVHVLLKPQPTCGLPSIMKGIKGPSARLINKSRGSAGSVWQDESWDRIIRNAAELDEKLQYMADNPVKAGLVQEVSAYDAWYVNREAAL